MNGTGTQLDPFQIVTWDDLITALSTQPATSSANQKYFKMMNDLDGNDRDNGEWNPIQCAYSSSNTTVYLHVIDMNNHAIRNIYYTGASGIFYCNSSIKWFIFQFKDGTFENIFAPSGSFLSTPVYNNQTKSADVFVNCKFAMLCHQLISASGNGGTFCYNFNYCSLTISNCLLGNNGSSLNIAFYKSTIRYVDCTMNLDTDQSSVEKDTYDFCRITGNITAHYDPSKSTYLHLEGTNSIFAAAVFSDTSSYTVHILNRAYDSTQPMIFCKDFFTGTTYDFGSNPNGTYEQCNDATWLQSQNFPVVRVTG